MILGIRRGIVDGSGGWAIVDPEAAIDRGRFRVVRVWHLGRIPWRNIREYDLAGDEHYSSPHIYCDFADDGTPYEDFAYVMLGDDYDWPLRKDKRIEPDGEHGPTSA